MPLIFFLCVAVIVLLHCHSDKFYSSSFAVCLSLFVGVIVINYPFAFIV